MSYQTEFPDFDRILDLDLFAAHGLADCSWHNDMVPAFDKLIGDYRIVLWVNYADPALREVADSDEFMVCVEADQGSSDIVATRCPATLDEALTLVDRFTRLAASGIVYVLQHYVDGDWSDMTTFAAYIDEDDAEEALDRWMETLAHDAHYRGEHWDINPHNYRVLERVTA